MKLIYTGKQIYIANLLPFTFDSKETEAVVLLITVNGCTAVFICGANRIINRKDNNCRSICLGTSSSKW